MCACGHKAPSTTLDSGLSVKASGAGLVGHTQLGGVVFKWEKSGYYPGDNQGFLPEDKTLYSAATGNSFLTFVWWIVLTFCILT